MEAENAHKHTESLTLHRHADFTAQYWKAAKMKERIHRDLKARRAKHSVTPDFFNF